MKFFKSFLIGLLLVVGLVTTAHAQIGYATAVINAKLNAITTYAGSGAILNLYNGTPPAACTGTPPSSLVTLTFSGVFASAASGGALTVNPPANGTGTAAAGSSGTAATWFRVTTSGGTCIFDGTVGTSGTDLTLPSATITTGETISISSWTLTGH